MSRTINDILDVADKHSHFTTRTPSRYSLSVTTCDECGWEVKPKSCPSRHESPFYRSLMTKRQHQADMIRQAFPNLEALL